MTTVRQISIGGGTAGIIGLDEVFFVGCMPRPGQASLGPRDNLQACSPNPSRFHVLPSVNLRSRFHSQIGFLSNHRWSYPLSLQDKAGRRSDRSSLPHPRPLGTPLAF